MKRITVKAIALALGLCAAAGLSAGVQADSGYTGIDYVWMRDNISHNKFLDNKKDQEDINKDKEDINKDKEGVKKYKKYIKKGKKYIKKGKKDDDGDKESVISLAGLFEEEKKTDKGSIEELCQGLQGLDKRLKKVEAKLKHLTDVIEQLVNNGVPTKQQLEENQEKLEKSFGGAEETEGSEEQSGIGEQKSADDQEVQSVVKEENNNKQVNLEQNLQQPAQNVQPPEVNLNDQQFVEAMKDKVGNARQMIANVNKLLEEDIDV